jgi:ADP-ribosyl-[dinitrogen reductase] hydrolase
MKARTSITHPLQIGTVLLRKGALGLTFCPGKKQKNAMTGAWNRSVERDLTAVDTWGARTVISLLEPKEYAELGVPELPEIYNRKYRWFNMPMPDKGIPSAEWMAEWAKRKASIRVSLDSGERILIHCKGGFGRTGLVACLILIDHGYIAETAINECRLVRDGAVETEAQVKFVHEYARIARTSKG